MNALILGAGPAGSSTAIQLRKAGFEVTIIDVNAFPRFRPGESCHPGIELLLQQLGVWEGIIQHDFIRYAGIHVSNDGIGNDMPFSTDGTWKGFQFPREVFDTILLNKAITMGAAFLPQTRTTGVSSHGNRVTSLTTDKGRFDFDFLIDATGSKSIVANKLGLEKEKHSRLIISSYLQLSTTCKLPQKFDSYFEMTPSYWGYISLIRPNTYSITYSSQGQAKTLDSSAFLNKHFRKSYKTLVSKSFETGWSITRNTQFENLYLVGDALMTFDPTSSKGILKAVMSGIYAAYLLACIKTGQLEKQQAMACYQEWGTDFFKKELAGIKQLLPVEMAAHVFTKGKNRSPLVPLTF